AFAVLGTAPPHDDHRCNVVEARWRDRSADDERAAGLVFEIEANRFLHHMVRFLVGTMLDIATDRRPASDLPRLLQATDNRVVSVQTEVQSQAPMDPFDIFFGGRSRPQTQAGLGTGFVVRKDGVVVTNAHVVSGANTISVMMHDGTVYPAKLLGTDETNDIAV